jgi:hypothetical protein
MVARLWWTPEPERLLLNTSEITQYLLPRDLRNTAPVLIECSKCDGNKGHLLWPDLSRWLRKPFDDFVRSGMRNPETITLPRSHLG